MKKGGVGGRGVRGGGRGGVEEGLGAGASVRRRIAGHSTAPKGGSRYERGVGGVRAVRLMAGAGCGWEGWKAKVYESKGTPNYSYTIHD